MLNHTQNRNRGLFAILLLALLGVGTGAHSAETMMGQGIVVKRDLAASTLQIDRRIFNVSASTTFTDLDGGPLTFESLRIFDVFNGVFLLADATRAEYRATRTEKGVWQLTSVTLIEEIPD